MDSLDGLNDQQRTAVTHDDGPLIVLAGPGTGKTRVIVHRIAHLIGERGADPSSIIATTFTNKAVDQLRDRLTERVGPIHADAVRVCTLNGLALWLVGRFADELGLPRRPDLMDSSQRRCLARHIARERGLFRGALADGLDASLAEAIQQVEMLQNMGMSPEQASAALQRWRSEIDSSTSQEAGDTRRLKQSADDFAEVVTLFEEMDRRSRAEGIIGYAEQIRLAAHVLRKSRRAADMTAPHARHVVVDEFQDVNPAQLALLNALCPPASRPDLCVVGDDDQAIYRFRGADDRAFSHFDAVWPGAIRIRLEENYRSTPPIVAACNAIISRAESRFDPHKTIRANRTGDRASVELVDLPVLQDDAAAIAALLLADRASGRTEFSWQSSAVIARSHKDIDRIALALALHGIPFRTSRAANVTDIEAVKDILAWMELLVEPAADWAAARLLYRPPINGEMERVAGWVQRRRIDRARSAIGEGGPELSVAAHVRAQSGNEPALKRFLDLHEELAETAAHLPADQTVERIIRATGAAHAGPETPQERARTVSGLVAVLRFVREKQPRLAAPGGLAEFWRYYNDFDERDRGFGVRSEEEAEPPEDDDDGPGSVALLTAHSAKGLEFDTVFVPRVMAKGYPTSQGGSGVSLPDFISGETETDRKHRNQAEERRVFYVACTRAERRLVLLAKPNKKRSKTINYYDEFRFECPREVALVKRTAGEVHRHAAHLGLMPSSPDALDQEAAAAPGNTRQRRARVLEDAKRAARVAAASALESASDPGSFDTSAAALHAAASLMAAAGALRRGEAVPAQSDAARELADRYAAAAASPVVPLRTLRSPLRLSYTHIQTYLTCPRCFYCRYILQLPEPPGQRQVVGSAVHHALEMFYRQWALADAEGHELPGRQVLLALARKAYLGAAPGPPDAAECERVIAIVDNVWRCFHAEQAHPLDTEKPYAIPFNGHVITGKIDRVDQAPDGSLRLIDYKTGTRKGLSKPNPKDLQLGIYAMALRHEHGGELPRGSAEYWLLTTEGDIGRVALESLDLDAVATLIDSTIRGILRSEFVRGKGRHHGCDILGAPPDQPEEED